MNATTTQSSVDTSPLAIPSSMASLASGAGASAAAVAKISDDEHGRHPPAVRAQQLDQAAELAPAPGRAAQAPEDVLAAGNAASQAS